MNYLAHAYFSYNEPATMAGNLISDFIKGKKQYDYPDEIQKGIRLHRAIDTFTDAHPAVAEAKQVFRPHYRLYAGAFVDVSFDYFIANDTKLFHTEDDLAQFAQRAYANLNQYAGWIPEIARGYFERMQQQNWLYHYRTVWGIQKSFGGIVYRSAYLTDSATAGMLFEEHISSLRDAYEKFIPDLQQQVEGYRQQFA
jgi:acyl carrier protein phosphodiesterase